MAEAKSGTVSQDYRKSLRQGRDGSRDDMSGRLVARCLCAQVSVCAPCILVGASVSLQGQ